MYKTAIEYYKQAPVKEYINYSHYQGPVKEYINYSDYQGPVKKQKQIQEKPTPEMNWKTKHHISMNDPSVWGPAFWFTLHNGSSNYPLSATPIVNNRMQGFILGIPLMLPCELCKEHASNHIENNKNNLSDICSGRDNLFKFFVDFHNIVNIRYNKPIVSVEDAYNMYDKGVNVNVLSYK
jgi:hypothetical protein